MSTKEPGTFRKQRFEWKVFRAWDIYRVLAAVMPYLVVKKAKALQVMDEIERRFGVPDDLLAPTEPSRQLQLAL